MYVAQIGHFDAYAVPHWSRPPLHPPSAGAASRPALSVPPRTLGLIYPIPAWAAQLLGATAPSIRRGGGVSALGLRVSGGLLHLRLKLVSVPVARSLGDRGLHGLGGLTPPLPLLAMLFAVQPLELGVLGVGGSLQVNQSVDITHGRILSRLRQPAPLGLHPRG